MKAGRRVGFTIAMLTLLATAGGCRHGERVENELRTKDEQLRESIAELNRTEAFADGLRRENEALRSGTCVTPEGGAAIYGVRKIVLGRATAGVDEDSVPGDEALRVWMEPKDADDHTIKAPGTLQVLVYEINSAGLKIPLSTWEVDEDKLRKAWTQGLLSTGYSVTLNWQVPPRVESLRVVARFTTPDGRAFEADRDIKVRLLPGAAGRPELPISGGDVPTFHSLPGSCPVQFGPMLPPNLRPTSHTEAASTAAPPTPSLLQAVHLGPATAAGQRMSFELTSPVHGLPSADEIQPQ
jgi:hypothetical protein